LCSFIDHDDEKGLSIIEGIGDNDANEQCKGNKNIINGKVQSSILTKNHASSNSILISNNLLSTNVPDIQQQQHDEDENYTTDNSSCRNELVRSFSRKQQQQNHQQPAGDGKDEGETLLVVGENETKAVLQLKLMVLSILVLSAIAVGGGTYWYLQRSEQIKFYDVYHDDVQRN
jgi:hypothetical protein